MSHFTVMVLSNGQKTVDELLAPYDESIRVEPYINRTKAQMIEDAKRGQKNILDRIREAKEKGTEYNVSSYDEKLLACKTDEEFYNYFYDEDEQYDEDGNELTTYNPKSKWDWYQVGGRWEGLLKAKKGVKAHSPSLLSSTSSGYTSPDDEHFDCALIKDLDFSVDPEEIERRERWWEVAIEGAPLKKGENEEDFRTFYRKEYFLNRYKDKKTYAEVSSTFSTFAVITPDGEWHEKGEMGWFGCSSETDDEALDWALHFKERFIDTMDPNTVVTIVDCHI